MHRWTGPGAPGPSVFDGIGVNMKAVAIDTAERRRITVVVLGDDGVFESDVLRDVGVDAGLAPALGRMDVAGLTAVVVVTGPGSHTGVRAGVAAAMGLAQAAGVPLFGVGALEVVAYGAPPGAVRIHAVADAGRGGLFVADYERRGDVLVEVEPPRRLPCAGHVVPPGAVAVGLDAAPSGLGDAVTVAASDRALAAASAVALRGRELGLVHLGLPPAASL